MKAPEKPADEDARLRELRSYNILDTGPEREFDETAELAAYICESPISLITLVDEGRQWYKAHFGAEASEHAREYGVCPHAILQDEVFEIPDLAADPRFRGNPLLENELGVRFYAGMPVTGVDGHRIGSICVLDHKPRELNDNQRNALRTLSRQITHQLALRRERRRNELLLREMRHRVQNGYQLIENLIFLHRNAPDMAPEDAFQALSDRVAALARIQKTLYSGADEENIDLKHHLSALIPEIERIHAGVNPHLSIEHELESLPIHRDKAVSAGLIVNEVITNAVKHAFPEPSPDDRITVRLWRERVSVEEENAVLSVRDNGVGSGANGHNGHSGNGSAPGFSSGKLGGTLIQSLASDLGATAHIQQDEGGTEASIRWKVQES